MLSNLLFVTESLTLIAGTSSLPASSIWYNRCTPVVVSSLTPFHSFTTWVNQPGRSLLQRLSRFLITCSSWLLLGLLTQSLPCSISYPLCSSNVASPPSSTISSGPLPPG